MTEAEWHSTFDLEGLLWNLERNVSGVVPRRPSDRQLRLFAVACIRHLLGTGVPDRDAILDRVEVYADASTNQERSQIRETRRDAQGLFRRAGSTDPVDKQVLFDAVVRRLAAKAAHDTNARCQSFDYGAGNDARRAIMRDIFGNPFRPAAFDPAWRTSTAVALASQMYESRDFGAMPILADALQDAGCDSEDVLGHCRGPGPHVRGCWVVDLVLGKT